jgi:hypothetical protein
LVISFVSLHINSSVAQLAPHTSAASTLFDLACENGMTVPASTQSQDAGLFLLLDDSNYPLHDFDYLALSTQADTTQAGTNWGDINFTASNSLVYMPSRILLVPMNLNTHSLSNF